MRAKILLVCFVVGAPLGARAHGRHSSAAAEEAQRRELMAELAAAAAEAPSMVSTDDQAEEKTDADLMYEAMRQWRGEPRGSAAVARVLAESQRVHQERKAAEVKLRSLFFKDPFADDPNLLIPVRKIDRQLLAAYEARHDIDRSTAGPGEVARLRGQLAEARADAAAARAEASRLRGELARGSDASDGACAAPASGGRSRVHGSRPLASNDRVSDDWAEPAPVRRRRHAKPRAVVQAAPPAPPPVAAETVVATPPAGWRSSDPRGIIVVPIETPVSIRADVPR
ncbi:MAG TPA: hypothetical protein VHM31_22660 [Polyangia bacterium]|nr:hypothetical protein [Polyangia bacterium]